MNLPVSVMIVHASTVSEIHVLLFLKVVTLRDLSNIHAQNRQAMDGYDLAKVVDRLNGIQGMCLIIIILSFEVLIWLQHFI